MNNATIARKLSYKTRFLNIFREIFKIPFLEKMLADISRTAPASGSLFWKLVPNNYQYPENSFRHFSAKGLKWRVDVSDFIGHSAYFGLDRTMDTLFELCKKDSVVLDIGVNIGWTALNLSRICTAGRVIGFEPDPLNYEMCLENVRLNKPGNLTLVPIALGSENGVVSMRVPAPSNRGGNRVSPAGSDAPAGNIRMMTVDNYCQESGISRIDLVKIDTEGYELRILKGATRTLRDHRPTLFIELNDDNLREQGDCARDLMVLLHSLGYSHVTNAYTNATVTSDFDFSGCHFDIIAMHETSAGAYASCR